jgi:hypothetical protein
LDHCWRSAGNAAWDRPGGTAGDNGGELGIELDRVGIEIAIQQNVVPRARRGLEKPALDFTLECAPGERAVTILRHPSGATTFHAPLPVALARRGRGPAVASLHFHIELAEEAPLRRGLISSASEAQKENEVRRLLLAGWVARRRFSTYLISPPWLWT